MAPLIERLSAPPPSGPEGQARLRALLSEDKAGDLSGLLKRRRKALACLAAIAEGSPYLWGLIEADPARLARLLSEDPGASLAAALERARQACDAVASPAEAMAPLRRLKQEAALLIALCDVAGVWDVDAVTAALTETADLAVSSALRVLLRDAQAARRLAGLDLRDPETGSGLIVLAMGKHGAGELNYSSDIDLILFYDPDAGVVPPDREASSVFVRLTKDLVRLLSERTEDGYVFRVDLRLRPDPGATAVAVSLPAAFAYYESVGQNWERAALIKARPCAGDRAAGEAFLEDIAAFIWRRHLDYAAIADVHAMKRQIQTVKGHEAVAVAGHDLKLGRGGIREIEFFVQTQQLIAGGRNPALRGRRTVDTLRTLCEVGWIAPDVRDDLIEAYLFLRRLEHRLQMVADEQTHALPREEAQLARLARFAGYQDAAGLGAALLARLETVQRHYARLFETAPALAASAGSLVFTGKEDDPETLETLARLGFSRPSAVAETVRGWHFGRYPAMRSARAREDLTEFTPALLEALARDGRADEALAAFDGLLSRMPSGYQLFSILRNNPRLLDTIALILGVAPRLAELLAARPHALDGMLEPPSGAGSDEDAMEERLAKALALADGYEDRLDRTRTFVRERMVIIGSRLLSGELAAEQAGLEISALAVAAVRVLLRLVEDELAAAHGRPPGGRVAVLAMGKLGGREMTATSDLDLIVLYDHDEAAIQTDGPRPIAPSAYFARLTQRLIAALSAPTAQGTAFSVDMRLRPSGRKGPVAIHLSGFAAYQSEEAWTWEHMALTRARVVAGDPRLARDVAAVIRAVLTRARDADRVFGDAAEMRRLLASEKGDGNPWDLKYAKGGLVDVEFLAQTLELVAAHRHPAVLATGTGAALDALAAAGVLSASEHETLRAAFRLYTALGQHIRLCVGAELDPKRAGAALRAALARATAQPDFSAVQALLADTQYAVTRIFAKRVDRTEEEH